MNKRISEVLTLLLVVIFVASFAFIAVSCKTEEPAETTESETSQAEEIEEVVEEGIEETAEETVEEEVAEEENDKVEYPVTIEDDKGQAEGFENRQLVLDGPITSVIAGETNFAMCLKEFGMLDAVTGIAYWIPDAVPELADSPQVIASGGLELEGLLDIAPELMVTLSERWWDPAVVQQVEDAGIMIYSIGLVQSLAHIKEHITEYGQMFDSAKVAADLVTGMEEKQAKVKDAIDALGVSDDEKPTVVYCMSIASEYGDWVPGANTFVDNLITEAGGVNIPADQGIDGWGEYSTETLLESDPDVIIVPISNVPGHGFTSIEDFTTHEVTQELTAVKEGKVFAVTGEYVNRLSFTTADALIEFAAAISGVTID